MEPRRNNRVKVTSRKDGRFTLSGLSSADVYTLYDGLWYSGHSLEEAYERVKGTKDAISDVYYRETRDRIKRLRAEFPEHLRSGPWQ